MKIPGSPGTQGLSRPPLIFSPSLPRRPDKERRKIKSLSIFDQLPILFRRFIVMDGQRVKELLTTHLEKGSLRWLKTVFSTFQDVDFDGSLKPLFIN